MGEITKGYTFGSTELVTSTKLNTLVDSSTLNIGSLPSSAGKILPQNLFTMSAAVTNASLIDISAITHLKVFYSTIGTIATFINPRIGQQFTVIAYQATFPQILDTGAFKLAGNWGPDSSGDNITLVWDGTNYIETARTNS